MLSTRLYLMAMYVGEECRDKAALEMIWGQILIQPGFRTFTTFSFFCFCFCFPLSFLFLYKTNQTKEVQTFLSHLPL